MEKKTSAQGSYTKGGGRAPAGRGRSSEAPFRHAPRHAPFKILQAPISRTRRPLLAPAPRADAGSPFPSPFLPRSRARARQGPRVAAGTLRRPRPSARVSGVSAVGVYSSRSFLSRFFAAFFLRRRRWIARPSLVTLSASDSEEDELMRPESNARTRVRADLVRRAIVVVLVVAVAERAVVAALALRSRTGFSLFSFSLRARFSRRFFSFLSSFSTTSFGTGGGGLT